MWKNDNNREHTMRHLITLACLAGAVAFYYFGFQNNAVILVAIAGAFELVFWKRLLGRRAR
jgi:hypothetical protein